MVYFKIIYTKKTNKRKISVIMERKQKKKGKKNRNWLAPQQN